MLLEQIHSWIKAGETIDDAIARLRVQTVPPGYVIHSWIEGNGIFNTNVIPLIYIPGKDESKVEKLQSILAQLEYKHQINLWNSKGIPFKHHLYVPEVHPVTGIQFCEREDEGHVFKVHVHLTF